MISKECKRLAEVDLPIAAVATVERLWLGANTMAGPTMTCGERLRTRTGRAANE